MNKISEVPTIMLAPPRSEDKPYWVALLKNLYGLFAAHANAINLLYENIEDDTEYLLPGRTYEGNNIYFQRFAYFSGLDGSGAPATAKKAHGITGLARLKWLRLHGGTTDILAVNFTPIQNDHILLTRNDDIFVDATNLNWRVNYDARNFHCHLYMEYQKT